MNIGLNYLLIRQIGMAGAAVATMLSHCLQLGMHHIYVRFLLKEGNYPFKLGVWAGYALAFVLAVLFVLATRNAWFLRWGVGAAIGLWELLRIRKRKVLI